LVGSITGLAVEFREVDLRDADFVGRLTIAIAAFPRRVIAGPPRAVLVTRLGRAANAGGLGFEFGMLSGALGRRACCCTAFRFMLATRRFPNAAPRGARQIIVPLQFRLSASGLCRSCAPVAGLAEKLKNTAIE
jgi:hypothetical protein